MKPDKQELVKMIKFGLVGVANTLVDMGVFALLAQVLGINIYISQVISYSAGMLNSYGFNRSWTFKTKENFISLQLLKFIVTNLLMLLLSMACLWFFNGVLSFHKMIAKCISVVIVLFINFIINRIWVFK